MIAEIGHLLLIGALVISFFVGFSPLCRFITKDNFFYRVTGPLNILVLFLVLFSFISLIYSFLNDDFSLAYVANNSNTLLPVYYKLAATWGAHEGSLLLWIFCLCLWATSYLFFNRKKDELIFEKIQNISLDGRRSILKQIKRILTMAVDEGLISRNPAKGITVTVPEAKQAILNRAEIDALLFEAKKREHPFYNHWALALLTGMRNGELHALSWTDVDFENKVISVT